MGSAFDSQFAPSHEDASRVRQEARRFLDASGVPSPLAADVELIIAELVTNAVEQAPTMPVRLDVVIADGAIYVSVANRSVDDSAIEFPESAGGAIDGVLADRGRGLEIVSALADGVWVHGDGEWTLVSCLRSFDQSSG